MPEEHRALLARHATSVKGATVLYSHDLLSSALRSFDHVLDCIRNVTFQPDKSRSGMITPARTAPVGAPETPFPPCPLPQVQRAGDGEVEPAATALPSVPCEKSGEEQLDFLNLQSDKMFQDMYSPGTPLDEAEVKQEFAWPQADWDDTVIDLEEQHDLLVAWKSGSEEESSSDEDSDSSEQFEWEEDTPSHSASSGNRIPLTQWYMNVKTNVINETKNDLVFKCGRRIGAAYVPVPALNGFRCGTCFTHCL